MNHEHKIWVSRIAGVIMLILIVASLFYSWKLSLFLLIVWLLALAGAAWLLVLMTFDTRQKWTIPAIIELADQKSLNADDRKRLSWIEKNGQKITAHNDHGEVEEALLLKHPDSKGLIFACHGYGDYSWQSIELPVRSFYEMGYSIFMPRHRGFGKFNGKWTTMGVKEREDHAFWLDQITSRGPKIDIFLYGVSMGAACVMNLADYPSNGQVRGIIEDCGFVSLKDQLHSSMNFLVGLDPFPLFPLAELIARFKPGIRFEDLNTEQKLSNSLYPILAIHGKKDDFVPFSNLERVKKAAGPNLYATFAVDGAAHCQSYRRKTDDYFRMIQQFLTDRASAGSEKEKQPKKKENSMQKDLRTAKKDSD